jgi:hypothetical protein
MMNGYIVSFKKKALSRSGGGSRLLGGVDKNESDLAL